MSDDEIQELIDEADRDHDNQINFDEFYRIMKKRSHSLSLFIIIIFFFFLDPIIHSMIGTLMMSNKAINELKIEEYKEHLRFL